ncbi:hypothetical protein Tco_1408528 [Tanacetum coccineum]
MASGGSDRDAEYALSMLLQMGTVTEYQNSETALKGLASLNTKVPVLIVFYFLGLLTEFTTSGIKALVRRLEKLGSIKVKVLGVQLRGQQGTTDLSSTLRVL